MSSRVVHAALIALVVAALGWVLWVLGDDARGGPPAGEPGPQPPVEDRVGEARPPQPVAPQPVPPQLGRERLDVELELVTRARLLPADADEPLARLMRATTRLDVARALAVPAWPRLAVDGPPLGRPRGRQLVRFWLADGSSLCRQLDLRDDETLVVSAGPRRLVRGRVLDAAGEPLADAELWAGEIDAASNLRTSRSREDGSFELELAAGEALPLCARAAGHAAVVRRVDVPEAGLAELVLTLPRALPRELVLVAITASPARARWHARPWPGDTAGESHAGFWRVLEGRHAFDDQGRATLDDAPEGLALALAAVHDEFVFGEAVRSRGSLDERALRFVGEPLVRGSLRALDAEGRPLPGVALSVAGSASVTHSDAEGRAAIQEPTARDAELVVRVQGAPVLVMPFAALPADRELRISQMPPEIETPATLVVRLADATRPWRVRVDGGRWHELAAGAAHELVGAPRLVDLRVRRARSGASPAPESFPGLVVAGRRELVLED